MTPLKKTIFPGFAIIVLILFSGCASIPGGPGSVTSRWIDSESTLLMRPAWVCTEGYGECAMQFSLFRNSSMPADEASLYVLVWNAYQIKTGPSLHFRVDGEFINLVADEGKDKFYVPPAGWSYMRYPVDMELLSKLVTAENVRVRLDLSNGESFTGVFSRDKAFLARPGFRKFLEVMEGI